MGILRVGQTTVSLRHTRQAAYRTECGVVTQNGSRVSATYHAGLQQGDIDGHLEGEGRVRFSFEGMHAMDAVHGGGGLQIEGAQARFVLAYHQGDSFTFICEQPTLLTSPRSPGQVPGRNRVCCGSRG